MRIARRFFLACTCLLAVALCESAALGSSVAAQSHGSQTQGLQWHGIEQIQSYGVASFRNAGMPRSEWSDGTQQLLAEMIERCPRRDFAGAVDGEDAGSRRELNRAVWRIVKRWKRQRLPQSLDGSEAMRQLAVNDRRRRGLTLEDLKALPGAELSDRQAAILHLLCMGYTHDDIASELQIAKAQISHEKYRAVQKLRKAWLESEA